MTVILLPPPPPPPPLCLCRKFVSELARVAAPGGRILIVTWCHRVLTPENPTLSEEEQALLDRQGCPALL